MYGDYREGVLLVMMRVLEPPYIRAVIWGYLYPFFCGALAFTYFSCFSTLLNLLIIWLNTSHVAGLTLDSWVSPVVVGCDSKGSYAKDWPNIDSFTSLSPDAEDSVSGWSIYNPRGEGWGYWMMLFGLSFLLAWRYWIMWLFCHHVLVTWHRTFRYHNHWSLSVFCSYCLWILF